MLADAVDGALSSEDQRVFDQHAAGCEGCGTTLAEAMRGRTWMEMLKAHPPEPPAAMMERILAETSVRTAGEQDRLRAERRALAEHASLLGAPLPVPSSRDFSADLAAAAVLPFGRRVVLRFRPLTHAVLQPRFMMTAAMAFFSIALTLNVAGVHLSQIHASDLRPSSLRRDFYQANAHVVRYYDNLRVVYELESRVHDLQRSSDGSTPAPVYPAADPEKGSPSGQSPDTMKPAGKVPGGQGAHSGAKPEPRSDGRQREPVSTRMTLAAYREGSLGTQDKCALEGLSDFERDGRVRSWRAL